MSKHKSRYRWNSLEWAFESNSFPSVLEESIWKSQQSMLTFSAFFLSSSYLFLWLFLFALVVVFLLPWWPTKLEDVSMMLLYLCGLWRRLARRRGQVVMMRKNKVGDPKVQECIYLRNQNDQHNQHMGRGMHEQVCWYCLQQRMVSHLIGVLQVKQLILSREDRRCWWYMKMMQVIWIRWEFMIHTAAGGTGMACLLVLWWWQGSSSLHGSSHNTKHAAQGAHRRNARSATRNFSRLLTGVVRHQKLPHTKTVNEWRCLQPALDNLSEQVFINSHSMGTSMRSSVRWSHALSMRSSRALVPCVCHAFVLHCLCTPSQSMLTISNWVGREERERQEEGESYFGD